MPSACGTCSNAALSINDVLSIMCILMTRRILLVVALILALPVTVQGEEPVKLKYTRQQIEGKWQARIQSFLDKGEIPLVDLLSFLPRENSGPVIRMTKQVMDKRAVALISFAGYEAPQETGSRGHRWDYFPQRLANADPDYFILTTNKGSNKYWYSQKGGKLHHFVDQLEQQVRGGDYAFIGQIEFRHYPSNAQCKAGRAAKRNIDIPLNGNNGHRVFRLATETGVPVAIQLEPEDEPLAALEEMLAAYPKAKIILSHFGQIRHPEREKQFTPALVERLLNTYPNLYYDLSTGEPGRYYQCEGHKVMDTVIWQADSSGGQRNTLQVEYKNLLIKYSNRFVVGFDFGAPNRQSDSYLESRIRNIRLILRDLPASAKHDIGYRNAWFLLTGRSWGQR